MASSMTRVTKADMIELLKNYKPTDCIGHIMSVQENDDSPVNQVLIPYHPLDGRKLL